MASGETSLLWPCESMATNRSAQSSVVE
jgi:hypothetical protein